MEDGRTFTSGIEYMMSLSPFSCSPFVSVNSDSVDLFWPDQTDVDKYVVERSESLDGLWQILRIPTTNYARISGNDGTAYYYRVFPYDKDNPIDEAYKTTLVAGHRMQQIFQI